MTLWQRYQVWRHRPGLVLAARLAEQQAWRHPNARHVGPEANLMALSRSIRARIELADGGDIRGLCLDATTPIAKLKPASPLTNGERDNG